MTAHRTHVVAALVVGIGMGTSEAAADQIVIATVTCISSNPALSCLDANAGAVWWRVLNFTPFPGSDIRNVTLEFEYAGGSRTWNWDVIRPAAPGVFGETDPFDVSLVQQFRSLRLQATLTQTVFAYTPYLKFVAANDAVSGSTTRIPPPLDVFAQGQFVSSPIPEPATFTLLGLGLAGLATSRRRRRAPPIVSVANCRSCRKDA